MFSKFYTYCFTAKQKQITGTYSNFPGEKVPLVNPIITGANKGKIDLLICGHTHRYGTYLADGATHHYPLVIGGGPLESKRTIIKVHADNRELNLVMLKDDGTEVGNVKVQSRKRR
jgi:hypothetical protein